MEGYHSRQVHQRGKKLSWKQHKGNYRGTWNYIKLTAASLTIPFLWSGAENKQGSLTAFSFPTGGASVLWGVSCGLVDTTEEYTGFSKFSFSSLPAAATCRRRKKKINILQRRKGGHKGKLKVKVKPKFILQVLAERLWLHQLCWLHHLWLYTLDFQMWLVVSPTPLQSFHSMEEKTQQLQWNKHLYAPRN